MSNKESLIKKTLIYFAGNFSSKIFSVIIIPIYATYLTASQLGKYDFQVTIANFMQPIIVLALWESILRFGLNKKGRELREVLSTAAFISVITLLFSSIILLCVYIFFWGPSIESYLYVLMIILLPIVTILGYMTRAIGNTIIYAVSGVASSFINLLGIIILVVFGKMGVNGLLLSTIIANIFNSMILFFGARIFKNISFKDISLFQARRLIRYSFPLIFNLVFGWFLSSFSRFYTNIQIGSTANGMYSFAMKFATIILQVTSIVNMTMIEDAVQTASSNKWVNRFEKNNENVIKLFFYLCYLLLPLIGIYYHTITNNNFQKSLIIVPFLIFSTILNNTSTLIGNVFQVFEKTNRVFITTLLSGFTNIVCTVLLCNYIGLLGVVVSQILSSIVLLTTRYLYGQTVIKFKFNLKKFLIFTVIYIAISILIMSRIVFLQILVLIIVCAYILGSYKDVVKTVLKGIFIKLGEKK